MSTFPLTLPAEPGCTPIPLANLVELIGQAAVDAGEMRLATEHFGPWQIVTSVRGVCETIEWTDGPCSQVAKSVTLHGIRTMSRPRESGYQLEGQVSVGGRKVRAFTSSMLFKVIETGRLISVGTIYACLNDKP